MTEEMPVTGTVFVDGTDHNVKCSVVKPDVSFIVEVSYWRQI